MMKIMLIVGLYILLLTGCGKESYTPYTYHPPADMKDGIAVGSLADMHADPALIEAVVDSIHAGRYQRYPASHRLR